MPSPDQPLTGGCACGAVAFEVTRPFFTAGYCHCKRCQRRSGTLWSLNAQVEKEGFRVTRGEEHVRTWRPENGSAKSFCGECGSQLFAEAAKFYGVRLGTVDGDPGIRPQYRQYLDSAPDWEPVPDDDLERSAQSRQW
jgi:hypothetical protein